VLRGVATLGLAALGLAIPARAQRPTSGAAAALDSLLQTPISAASRYNQTASEAPASMTIITAEEIQRFGYRTLADVLERTPSFYMTSDRNYTYVGVRGFGRPTDYNNRVLLLVNGYAQNETFYGGGYVDRAFGLNMNAVDHIEIARGPASALYGSSAMFAVINVVTVDGAQFAGGRVFSEFGDHGQAEAAATVGGRLGKASALLAVDWGGSNGTDVYFPVFDSPATNDGIAHALDAERYQSGFLTIARGDVTIQASVAARRKAIPTASWGTRFNARGAGTYDISSELGLAYRRQLQPTLSLSARARVGRYDYHGWYPGEALDEDLNAGLWGGANAQLVWDVAPRHRVSLGADFVPTLEARYVTYTDRRETYNRDFPFTTWGAYVSDEYELTKHLTVVGGVRYDGHSRSQDRLTPRLALIATPDDRTTVKVLWGRAFRTPTVYEREYSDSLFVRSAGLSAEWIRSSEVVLERRLGAASWATLSLFDNHVGDLIDTYVDPATDRAQFRNLGESRARGVELNTRIVFGDVQSAYLALGYTRADAGPGAPRLSNSPGVQAMAGWSRRFAGDGRVSVEGRLEDARRTLAGAETRRAVLLNANIVSPPLWKGLALSARVLNALNQSWAVPGGAEHRQDVIPQRGRSLYAGARVRW